jgi:hypothetical protein
MPQNDYYNIGSFLTTVAFAESTALLAVSLASCAIFFAESTVLLATSFASLATFFAVSTTSQTLSLATLTADCPTTLATSTAHCACSLAALTACPAVLAAISLALFAAFFAESIAVLATFSSLFHTAASHPESVFHTFPCGRVGDLATVSVGNFPPVGDGCPNILASTSINTLITTSPQLCPSGTDADVFCTGILAACSACCVGVAGSVGVGVATGALFSTGSCVSCARTLYGSFLFSVVVIGQIRRE